MFSIFTPPTHTRNHSHRSYLFKLFALFALLTVSISAAADGYKLVKNASELSAGDIILITSGKSGNVKALGPQATNNRTGASVTISDETISSLGEAVEITLENVNKNGYFSLKTGENKYLYAASSSSNHLKEKATADFWLISVNTSTYAATITDKTTSYTRNILRYNSQSIIFSCYGSGQQNVYIFKKQTTPTYALTIDEPVGGTIAVTNNGSPVTSGEKFAAGTKLDVTATPATGYSFSTWTGITSAFADASSATTTFTMPAEDTEIGATFQATSTPPEYHNVTFSVNGQKSETTEVEVGASIPFPANPADIYGKKFVGWYGAKYSHDTKEPVYVNTATEVMGTADVTYYAVFANLTPASCTETAISDFSASDVMIIVGKSGDNYYALSNDNGTSKAPTAESVTVENGKITSSVRDNMKWNRKLSGDYYQFYVSNESDYLYCISDNNGVRVGSGNENNKFSITTDGYLKNSGQNRYLGIYNKADWRCYTSINTNIQNQTFTFYKYIARKVSDISTTVKEPATLESIAVTTAPTKTHYFVGETFEPAGMVVTATYDDDDKSSKNVTDYTYSPTGELTTDDNEITISYTERGTTKTTKQAITVVTPQEAGIAFEKSTVSTPLNSGYTGQALTNPNSLTVAYTSSNPSVATVDGSTGEVTLKATGTTTITASFTRNDTYQSAEVSYELTVTNAVHTITFMVNGKQQSTDNVAEGATIKFPEVDDIAGKSVVGWRTSKLENITDTEPDDMVTSATMPAADVTYYAVFVKEGIEEENIKLTITPSTTNIPTEYGSANTFTEYTLEGVKFSIQQMYKNGEKLQWRAAGHSSGTGTMYNTDALNKIQSIVLTYESGDANKNFTVSVGDEENPTLGTSITPTNDGSVYTFDCSEQNKSYFVLANGTGAGYLKKLEINYIGTVNTYSGYCTTVTTGETSIGDDNKDPASGKYYATYSSIQKFVVPEDVTVAQVVEKDGRIYLERYKEDDVVAANTGVLLESENPITTAFELTNKEATNLGVTNVLKASGDGITADKMGEADNPDDNYFYRLTKGTLNEKTVFGFYWKKTDGSAFDLGANKAYMVLQKSNVQTAPRYVWLGGQTTAIDGLNADTEATVGSDERIYSLDGRRVEGQLKRGIYVKNGKKFIVR